MKKKQYSTQPVSYYIFRIGIEGRADGEAQSVADGLSVAQLRFQ